ncbi:MAG TPA: sugar porter family MFS transporter [Streptosporangiaceae bacterium]|nr:sugar porter family MFS transporter [Streptosporangiaceae bacterium]
MRSSGGNGVAQADSAIRRRVVGGAAITALGGLLFGYDTGVVSGALLFLRHNFGGLSNIQEELVTSLLLVGAMAGALLAGRLADRIGRKPTILITATVFVVGVLLAAFTPSYAVLLVARVIIGLAVGASSLTVPLYIGEAAPPAVRGGLVSLNQLAITIGILVSYLVDYGLASSGNWRLMFGLAALPAVLLFIGILTQHESPHWLVERGRETEARAVLARLRRPDEVEPEVTEIREVISRGRGGLRELLAAAVRPALFVGVMMAVFQQVTGINTVIYYAPSLLHDAGLGASSALLANVGIGIVNVGMTIVAIRLLDRTGRRPLLIFGSAGMAAGMCAAALAFLGGTHLSGGRAAVAIGALVLYTGSFAIGLGPVFWLLISEIYPLRVRGSAMSVASMANWAANFVVTVSFLTLLSAIGGTGVFFLFGFLTLVAIWFFIRRVPETKGRSLPAIEADLRRRSPETPPQQQLPPGQMGHAA